jgi:hypothetical protein
MVVLVILGVLAGVSVSSLPSLREGKAPLLSDRLGPARRTAIMTGAAVSIGAWPVSSSSSASSSVPSVEWRFLPDGRALGPGLDQRDGRLVDTSLALAGQP